MRIRPLGTVLLILAFLVSLFPFNGVLTASAQATAVPVTNAEGIQVGSITVTEVADPFTGFDPSFPPEAGSHYAALTVAFDADSGQRFDIAPYTIVLQDDQGFLWNTSSLYLPDDALIPELSSQTLSPGSRITGLVGFVLPEGTKPARVFYQPESSRLVTLATLLEQEMPVVGDAVALSDAEGGMGAVTVTDIVDPFTDVDPGQTAPEGARFVLVTLTYENTSDGRFFIEPYGLTLRDSDGYLWPSTYVSRPDETSLVPDLASAQLSPGDRLSGAVTFAVPVDADLAELYASPVSGRLLILADLEGAAEAVTEPPVAIATPAATPSESTETTTVEPADSTESTTEETGASATTATDACADLAPWLATARARIAQAEAMSAEDATLTDLEALAAHAAAYRSLAEAQIAETAPPEAAAVGKALAATLNAHGAAIEQVLGATEPGKDTMLELTEATNSFTEAGARLQQIVEELNRIEANCG
jgi:hypothetical protein